MTHSLLRADFLEFRTKTAGLLGRLAELCDRAGMADLREMTHGLLTNINDPFLFVIVGEVKTGKSSLINALLGEQICPVAPDPCTDRIRIIGHADVRSEREESPLVVRAGVPAPILKDIAIVDTPGVDSIIDRHQEITEGFIPRCDLALFVFSAINPYSRSAWEFFDLVNAKWRRKIVFVLNQADLASPEQLEVNARSVESLARERGMESPRLFLTSGKAGAADPEKGGVESLRAYIRETVTGGRHYAQKLLSAIRSAERALARMDEAQRVERRDLEEDLAEAGRIRERLASARKSADREIERLVDRATGAYAKHCMELVEEIERELRFGAMLSRSVKSLFNRKKEKAIRERTRELMEAFRRNLDKDMELLARQGAEDLAETLTDRIRPLAEDLERAAARRARSGKDGDRLDLTSVSRQREKVLAAVAEGVAALLDEGAPLAAISPKSIESMDPNAAMGSLLVVIGAVFAVAVKSVIIDVTGGVVAGAGMLVAGSALAWKRPRLVRALKDGLAKGGGKLEEDLAERLAARMRRVFDELDDRFAPFFGNLEERGRELQALTERREGLEREFGQLAATLARFDGD